MGILALANKDTGYTEEDVTAVESLAAAFMEVLLRASAEESLRLHVARLETANRELDAFSYSVSHDLRAPLRSIDGFSRALLEDFRDQLDGQGGDYLERIRAACRRMGVLIDNLLRLSQITAQELNRQPVDLSQVARTIARDLHSMDSPRVAEFVIEDGLLANGDEHLLRAALQQILENAWKFTSKQACARIEVGRIRSDGPATYFVRDNGAGFDMTHAQKLFGAFQRLHTSSEYPGTGIGLATVQRIIDRHGGRIWADSSPGKGTVFYFTL